MTEKEEKPLLSEDISDSAMTVAAQVSQLTYEELKNAIGKLLTKLDQYKINTAKPNKGPELKTGKQTLEQMKKHNDGLSTIELTKPNLRILHRSMKKDNVDFAAVKDGKGKYTLFFKGKDVDALTPAFTRYTKNLVKQANSGKPSINTALSEAKKAAQSLNNQRGKVQNMNRGALVS